MVRQPYDTDLTFDQWTLLRPPLSKAKPGGRPRSTSLLAVINAIFYLLHSRCPWRLMPHDFPAWQTVYTYFRAWEADGTWERLNCVLRERFRIQAGRNRLPSAACVDSQSVKTAAAAQEKGFDGGEEGERAEADDPRRYYGIPHRCNGP